MRSLSQAHVTGYQVQALPVRTAVFAALSRDTDRLCLFLFRLSRLKCHPKCSGAIGKQTGCSATSMSTSTSASAKKGRR